ncbi:MAG: lysylphosphatidylglycerol synthase transmembrane domain-containing protein [Alistipes sp.]
MGAVGYMLWKDFDIQVFSGITFSWHMVFWLVMAVVFMFGRDIGYIIRIRILSNNQLSWRQAFRVIMLWGFTSAITPSAVGGTSVAIIYVHKEGISVGRSSAIVMLTSFLDELYFIVMFPLLILIVGPSELFDVSTSSGVLTRSLMGIALTGYFLKLGFVLVLSYGLFVNPRGLKWLLLKVFKLKFLRRWYHAAGQTGTDIIRSSHEIRRYNYKFWLKACSSTFLSWSSRYLVANALIMAFFAVSDQFLLFARQLVIWIMMLVMPTPGGSGFAEYVFFELLQRPDQRFAGYAVGSGHADRPAVARGNLLPLPRHRRDHLPALDQEKIHAQTVIHGFSKKTQGTGGTD